jgi:hypothetical protein
MTTQISSTNIQPTTLAVLSPVTITGITVTNSSWTPLDDSAVSTSGGFIVITGTNFATGCNVIIGSTNATSVAFVNSTTLRVQVPASSAGTYVVYVTNTNGTTAIVVNGLTYSGTPTWVTASPLPQGVTSIPISIQLSATGDTPLTYVLQAGSTLPSGLALSSSGLLSGTVTGLTVETTYNFTIEAIDPQLQDSPKAFAITIVAGDQFWDYVTLLLPGTTSTSIFNDDASTNNFPITVVGDTRPNNFGPYTAGYYSNFFDGTGDYLTVPNTNSVFSFGTGNFTVEAWVNMRVMPSGNGYPASYWIVGGGPQNSGPGFDIAIGSTNLQVALVNFDSSLNINFAHGMTAGVWYHIAVVRNINTLSAYKDGVLLTSASVSGITADPCLTGLAISAAEPVGATSGNFNGYISNLRIVKGTAVYTSNFTPPTQPLTAISGTSLLTCQSNRFIDNSTNNFAITRNGDTRIDGFDPFVIPSSIGVPNLYSTSFDGTGDYLTVASNAATTLNADFTTEFWVYRPVSGNNYFFCLGDSITSSGIEVYIGNTGAALIVYSNGANRISSATLPAVGSWSHVAVVRSGTTVTLYLNGTLLGNWTSSATFSGTTYIGAEFYNGSITGVCTGNISNLRIVKGTAVYTANFIPPTQPLTAISGTSLLTCQNSTLIDNSTNNFAITSVGQAQPIAVTPFTQTFTSQTITGTGSTYFDGNGDYWTAAANTAFNFGTGDFTIECWVYPIANGQNFPTFLSSVTGWSAGASGHRFNNTGYANKFWFGLNGSGGVASGDPFMASASTFGFNTWYHYSVTRSGNTFRMFVNGVLENTQTFTGSYDAGLGGLRSGWSTWDGVQGYFTGYTSNLRLLKGTALYTANFTPPAQPLTAITNTSLLTGQTNQPNNNNMFLDSSTNNFLITRNGNTTQGTFSPYAENWSNFFGGTGNYLTAPAASPLNFGNSNFTVECWIYGTGLSSNNFMILSNDGPTRSVGNISFFASPTNFGIQRIIDTGGNAETIQFTGSVPQNQWVHLAATKVGTTVRLFLNGSLVTTQTTSYLSWGNQVNTVQIGRRNITSFENNFIGYISNLRVINGTALYTSNFTPSTTPLQPIANTSLLTCRDSSIVDDSANRFAITVVGSISVQRFGPFAGTTLPTPYYGAFFDGNGDFLTIPNNAAFNISANFTIEMWIYPTALSGIKGLFGQRVAEANFAPILMEFNGATLQFLVSTSGSSWAVNLTSPSLTANTWTHIALVRSGTTVSYYINGVAGGSSGTATGALMTPVAPTYIGADAGTPSGAGYFPGYISNFRIVNGTAVYTSNFTPSTIPLTAISGTSLLTCQSATFIDNSTNNFAIAVSGNSQPTFFNPFTVTYSTLQSYSPSVFGGSMYFDGTGDFLTVPTNTAFSLSSDFTVEFWIYTSVNGVQGIISTGNGGTVQPFFYLNGLTPTFLYNNVPSVATGPNITLNAWNHIAYSRSGSSIRVFTNGVAGTTASPYTDSFTNSGIWISGNNSNTQLFTGYISDVRIVKGTALYTSNFVPSNQPLTAVQNSVLLLNGTGAAIYDASTVNNLETAGDTRISVVQSKWSNTSMSFDGSGDRLALNTNQPLNLTGNFTIEMWVNLTSLPLYSILLDISTNGTAGGGMTEIWVESSGSASYYVQGTTLLTTATGIITSGTWNHIAVVKNGTSQVLYVNGVSRASATSATQPNTGLPWWIGDRPAGAVNGNYPINGFINDFRVTNGVARYTANFTPPTTPFLTN